MKYITLVLALFILENCNSNQDIITPYDYVANFPDTKNGLTQKQVNEYFKKSMNQIRINTVGKKLPEIYINNIHNKRVRLDLLINQITFIYATDNHCGWGLEVLENDLPYAIEKLESDSIKINVIALLIKSLSDSTDLNAFNQKATEVNLKYNQFYIIDESEAKKINALNATRLFVDKQKIVIDIGYGAYLDPDTFYETLKSKLLLTSQQPQK